MSILKPFLVDVPVQINIWTRPECQRRQFDIIKLARPSILFLQSDGGRNEEEWEAIMQNRAIYDNEVDWECEIHRIYASQNNGLYSMLSISSKYIWERVDRCIFLEDDQIPSVSFFRFCAELLEKYKEDERIEMITGNNVFGQYLDAMPNDYFFSSEGWSIWGVATWRDRAVQREFPLSYSKDEYVLECLKNKLPAFWFDKARKYSKGIFADGHVPGPEYYHAINSALYNRVSIIPTKNMICNIGVNGAHAKRGKNSDLFEQMTYEICDGIKHPLFIIDDVKYGKMYSKKLKHGRSATTLYVYKVIFGFRLLISGKLLRFIQRKKENRISEY